MQLLSRGDAGPPVAEVRAALEEMGILEPAGPGPALFDDMLEQAIADGHSSKLPIGRVLAEAEQPIDIHWAS